MNNNCVMSPAFSGVVYKVTKPKVDLNNPNSIMADDKFGSFLLQQAWGADSEKPRISPNSNENALYFKINDDNKAQKFEKNMGDILQSIQRDYGVIFSPNAIQKISDQEYNNTKSWLV